MSHMMEFTSECSALKVRHTDGTHKPLTTGSIYVFGTAVDKLIAAQVPLTEAEKRTAHNFCVDPRSLLEPDLARFRKSAARTLFLEFADDCAKARR